MREASRRRTDITRPLRAKRWCARTAWLGYVIGSYGILFALAIPSLAPLVAALFAASYALAAGSRIGAGLHLVLVCFCFGYVIYNPTVFQPSIGGPAGHAAHDDPQTAWLRIAVLLVPLGPSLIGVWASVVYQRFLPAGPRGTAERGAVAGRLRRLWASLHHRNLPQIFGCYALMALLALLLLLPVGLFLLSLIFFELERFRWAEWLFWTLLVLNSLAVGPAAAGMVYLHTKAKRLRAMSTARLRAVDPRPPVLLLRSFRDDLTTIKRRLPFSKMQPSEVYARAWTLEEALERAMSAYGPVIAIGRPGEALPPAGAAREYLVDEAWTGRVERLIDEARFVVAVVGKTEGLVFEYGAVRTRGALGKLMLIFPPVDAAEARERWGRFCDVADPEWRDLIPGDGRAVLMVRFPGGTVPEFVTCRWREDEDGYRLALRYGAASSAAQPRP